MKRFLAILALTALIATPAYAGFWDDVKKDIKETVKEQKSGNGLSDEKVIAGLKEALDVGTKKAVEKVSKLDGYFKNPNIKIPVPQKINKVESTLRKIGLDKEVDKFVLSMNRAAEKAAPKAVDIFVSAIKGMSFTDARRILEGNETAATDFFKEKTSPELRKLFLPPVSEAMDKVGATRNFKKMMDKYSSLPFMDEIYVDLDAYVTDKALEGLFKMVAEEEKKIRKDPAARVTELLRQVFAD